ncbi:hypothetical protein MYX06_00770 [Patescibacteria group bacterium AH-259-L05]|nr:hypothetical protein [Patescibacteria group bacterium AH-259-L05]
MTKERIGIVIWWALSVSESLFEIFLLKEFPYLGLSMFLVGLWLTFKYWKKSRG